MAEFVVVFRNHDDSPVGELLPMNLEFELFLNEVGTIQFDMSLSHPLAKRAKIAPYVTDYYLYRDSELLQAGMMTSVRMSNENEVLQIAGKDWLHYLERRQWMFSDEDPTFYKFQKKNKDVVKVVESLLDKVLAEQYSLENVFYNNTPGGFTVNYKIDIADTEDILSKIKNLSEQEEGFDYEMTPWREFKMYVPSKGSIINYPLIKDENIYTVTITDNGIRGNWLLAQGAGTATKLTRVVDSSNSKRIYRRHDYSQDFGNLTDSDLLTRKAKTLQNFSKSPLFEFDVVVMPQVLEDVYSQLQLGDSVPINGDFGYMSFTNRYHRIVNMKGEVNLQGDEKLTLGVNDIPSGVNA